MGPGRSTGRLHDVASGEDTGDDRGRGRPPKQGLTLMGIGDPPHASASKLAVILAGQIRLAVGGDIDRTFDFNLDGVFGPNTERAILFFNLTNASALELSIKLRNYQLVKRYPSNHERSVHEVVGPRAVSSGANQLTFAVREGSCTISDVVLWHQVRP